MQVYGILLYILWFIFEYLVELEYIRVAAITTYKMIIY